VRLYVCYFDEIRDKVKSMNKVFVVISLFATFALGGLFSVGFFSGFESTGCLPSSVSHNTDCSGGKIPVALAGISHVVASSHFVSFLFSLGLFAGWKIIHWLSFHETSPPVVV
jgi:hypothetical protein